MSTCFVSIDYDDCKQSSYKAVIVEYEEKELKIIKRFDSGNVIIDYIDFLLWCSSTEIISCMFSSNFGHFLMDGNRYKEMFVKYDETTDEFVEASKEELTSMNFKHSDYTKYITKHPYTTFESLRTYYYKIKGTPRDKQKK